MYSISVRPGADPGDASMSVRDNRRRPCGLSMPAPTPWNKTGAQTDLTRAGQVPLSQRMIVNARRRLGPKRKTAKWSSREAARSMPSRHMTAKLVRSTMENSWSR